MEIRRCALRLDRLDDLKSIYYDAFPPQERISLGMLLVNSLRKKGKFHLYLSQDELVGFAYTIEKAELYYILMLAVDKKYRSQGIGRDILNDLSEQANGREQLITIEPIEEGADNYQQRLRRLAFYERQGFKPLMHTYQEDEEIYQIISTVKQPHLKTFSDIMTDFFRDKVFTAVN
ncbi:GNAT family N-acetyltransferase [Streptococcus orisratti]